MFLLRWVGRHGLKFLAPCALLLVLSAALVWGALHWFLHHEADRLVTSAAFVRMLEQATDKGLKLEGHYGPLHRTDTWSVATPSYSSVGRPGEAIAFLDASDIRATFDPWGVLQRQWVVSRIDIGRARMGLRAPVDALKVPFPEGKRPWYAFLLPTRFVPVVTECPQTDLTFSFLGQEATATGMRVRVFPYGAKDWRIVASDGNLSMRLLPPLWVQNVEFTTARTFLDFQNFLFLSPAGQGSSRVEGRARLGMHEDKSLVFSVRLEDLPISYALPGELGEAISGLAHGWVTYHRPGATREGEDGSGQLVLRSIVVQNLPVQTNLVRFTGDPGFERIEFNRLSCSFALRNGTVTVPALRLVAPGLIEMNGRMEGAADGSVRLDMALSDFPLARWLPREIKNHVQGQVAGRFLMQGDPKNLRQLQAWTFLKVTQGVLDQLPLLRPFYRRYGINRLRKVTFDQAQFEMTYGADLWELKSFSLVARDLFQTHGYASLHDGGDFVVFAQLTASHLHSLLPTTWHPHFSGSARVRIALGGNTARRQDYRATGFVDLAGLRVEGLKAQANLARFFKDPSWLEARFNQLSADLDWREGVIRLTNIRALIPGRLGLSGQVTLGADQSLSGRVRLGCGEAIVGWLGPAGSSLFPEKRDGLHWTEVTLSGTVQRPENDLVPRLRAAILSHPGLFLKATVKAISWMLGDWFSPERFHPSATP
ncbi:MAG: hypothetical protein OHK005_06130 [Candidatus Methylacidiphilales bacterium]